MATAPAWGAILLGYRGVSGGQMAGAHHLGDSLQAGMELCWRPAGYRDGGTTTLRQASRPLGQGAAPSGGPTTQAMLGARVKPLSSLNLVLAIERRLKVGRLSSNDWLLRAGYSYTHGTDLRIDADSWFTVQVYAEAGRFLRAHRSYATFEANLGRSIRLNDSDAQLVLFPHLVLAADHDSKLAPASAAPAAPASVAAVAVQPDRYQAPVLPRRPAAVPYPLGATPVAGVFLRANLNF